MTDRQEMESEMRCDVVLDGPQGDDYAHTFELLRALFAVLLLCAEATPSKEA